MVIAALAAMPQLAEAQNNNLRQSIAVVFNKPDSGRIDKLKDYSLWLSRLDKRQASRAIAQECNMGFGSGAVVEYNDNHYVITNSHVVGIGSSADVWFMFDNDTIILKNCDCVYQNSDDDIALLRLPDNMKPTMRIAPLPLSDEVVVDGTKVYSAGYPALVNAPSWQFGSGIVSNAELVLPSTNMHFIQHTAQIDKGSSGSPLLIKSDDKYEIVGLSTMKAYEREAVGIAIPADALREALRHEGEKKFQQQLLFLDTLSVEEYAKMYSHVPEQIIKIQDSLFLQGKFLEGLAVIPGYADTATLMKRKRKSDINPNAAVPVSKNKAFCGIDRDFDFDRIISADAVLWFPSDFFYSIGINFQHEFGNFLRTGMKLSYISLPNEWYGITAAQGANISCSAGPQIPFTMGRCKLVPYVMPQVGISLIMEEVLSVINFGGSAGCEFWMPLGYSMIFIGMDYNIQYFTISDFNAYDNTPMNKAGGVGVHIGIAL